jgi:UDP-N-acetylmuramate-alanine ligase
MLAELMRFKSCVAVGGTHGKTTTTSLVAALLDSGGLDPTVINGGIINAYGTNARLGKGDWMVVESDESDGTFVKLPADVVIVTNIDPEHLDHYGSFDKAKEAFLAFVENIPFYGFAVMCIDHPGSAGADRAGARSPHHHLWAQPASRYPPRRYTLQQWRDEISRSASPTGAVRPSMTSRT